MATEIKVKVITQGGDEHDIETPTDIKAGEFLQELISALKLPKTSPDGGVIVWRMDNKDTGKTLNGDVSMVENGVRDGHRLSLIRQVTAGSERRVIHTWKS